MNPHGNNALDLNARYLLYVYSNCEPSRKLMRDLQQLPEDVQYKIEVIDIVEVLESGNYPPSLNQTPCLFVTNTKLPSVHNGRRSILLFYKLRAHDAVGTMEESQAFGRDAMGAAFEKTQIETLDLPEEQSKNLRRDGSKLKTQKQFEMLGNEESQTATVFNKFDSFIDDPTLGNDPRLARDLKKIDFDSIRSQRGYA